MRDPSDSFLKLLSRGLLRRCARCGSADLFPSLLTMTEHCPSCGLYFERESGYWIGAMIVATAFTLVGFLAVFVGGIAMTWPAVPWNLLLLATIAVAAIVPISLYPIARTLWVAMDLSVRPLEDREIARASRFISDS